MPYRISTEAEVNLYLHMEEMFERLKESPIPHSKFLAAMIIIFGADDPDVLKLQELILTKEQGQNAHERNGWLTPIES